MTGVIDERGVVGDVQPSAGQRAQAEVVLFAVAEGEAAGVDEIGVVVVGISRQIAPRMVSATDFANNGAVVSLPVSIE